MTLRSEEGDAGARRRKDVQQAAPHSLIGDELATVLESSTTGDALANVQESSATGGALATTQEQGDAPATA